MSLTLLCFAFFTFDGPYRVALKSGQEFYCAERVEPNPGGRVTLKLMSGPVLEFPNKEIDWKKTAIINGEAKGKINTKSDSPSFSGGEIETLKEQFDDLVSGDLSEETFNKAPIIFGLSLILVVALLCVFDSVLYWIILRMLGEYAGFFGFLMWNLSLKYISFVIYIVLLIMWDSPLTSWSICRLFYSFALIWLITIKYEGEVINVILANLIFNVITILLNYLIATMFFDDSLFSF